MNLIRRQRFNQQRTVRLMSVVPVLVTEPVAGLTCAEMEVLVWLSRGKQFKDIAVIMDRSVNSITQHAQRMRMKLGANTAAGAVGLALRRNIIE